MKNQAIDGSRDKSPTAERVGYLVLITDQRDRNSEQSAMLISIRWQLSVTAGTPIGITHYGNRLEPAPDENLCDFYPFYFILLFILFYFYSYF